MFDELARHVRALGGLERTAGGALQPLTNAEQGALALAFGAPLPAALRWWMSTFGCGIHFVQPIVFSFAEEGDDALLGYFIDADEIRQTIDDFEGSMAPHRLPINDDGFGNFIVVDPEGVVGKHYHDAPRDRCEHRVADTFERFVLMLRRGD